MVAKAWGVIYRPRTWAEFAAPKETLDALKNITASTMLVGPTGSGKTSAAQLIADMHNGEIIDFNAAVDTGIDKIRELLETVKSYPFQKDRYVVVIDEAHALSAQAIKALLKDAESESENGPIWLILTNQPDKFSEEFKTRFNTIVIKYPTVEALQELCDEVLEAEGVKSVPEDLIDACIENAQRNPRSTLNTLQDAIKNGLHKNTKAKSIDDFANLLEQYSSSIENSMLDQLVEFLVDGQIPNNSVMAVYATWSRILNYIYFKKTKPPTHVDFDRLGEMFVNKLRDVAQEDIIRTIGAINKARGDVLLNGVNPVSALIENLWTGVLVHQIEAMKR